MFREGRHGDSVVRIWELTVKVGIHITQEVR